MKKNKLSIEYDYDFDLVGIITPIKEYKLAWLLNTSFGIELEKQADIEINFLKNKICISNYLCESENSQFRLLKNKGVTSKQNIYLLPELSQFDFLIMVQDEGGTFEAKNLTNKLKLVDAIRYVANIDLEQLKNKENLLF